MHSFFTDYLVISFFFSNLLGASIIQDFWVLNFINFDHSLNQNETKESN
jgi:hypothetical protein